TLRLPVDADIQGVLETRLGQIQSDFALDEDEDDERRARIKLGDGAARVQIKTDQDIILQRE
ncbi:MAG: hypothetical protein HOB49_03965, partial [Gemmatimonadetes bacterium]|nr:hypothetical protein [Gemmatimonadota bacterium]